MSEFKAIFIGAETVFQTWIKIEDDTIYYKPKGLFSSYQPLLGNIDKELLEHYQTFSLFDPEQGVVNDNVRVYFFDVKSLKPFMPGVDQETVRKLKSLRGQVDFLKNRGADLKKDLDKKSTGEGLMKDVKKRADETEEISKKFTPKSAFNKDNEGGK